MSNRKFAVPQTIHRTGMPVLYFAAMLATAAVAFAPITAQAQTAADVYKKMSAVYATAKSYQGTISSVQDGKTNDGKPGTQTVTIKVSFKYPNKYLLSNSTAVNVVGAKPQSTSQTTVSDGKALYMYSAEKKLYIKGQVQNVNILSKLFAQVPPSAGFAMLPASTVNGRPAFVLKPNLPATNGPADKVTIMIDKQNYQFLKMTVESVHGHLIQSVTNQSVNGSVPDSIFVWSPPATYKEVKPRQAPTGAPNGAPTGAPAGTPTTPGRPVGK